MQYDKMYNFKFNGRADIFKIKRETKNHYFIDHIDGSQKNLKISKKSMKREGHAACGIYRFLTPEKEQFISLKNRYLDLRTELTNSCNKICSIPKLDLTVNQVDILEEGVRLLKKFVDRTIEINRNYKNKVSLNG